MTDHLHPVLDDAAIARMTSLAPAHVGDAVSRDISSCARIWRGGGTSDRENLHSRTIQLVQSARKR